MPGRFVFSQTVTCTVQARRTPCVIAGAQRYSYNDLCRFWTAPWLLSPGVDRVLMPKNDQLSPGSTNDSSPGAPDRPTVSSRLNQFEKRQRDLWRITFLLLLLISIGFAVVSWGTIRSLTQRLEPLLPGLVVIVVLFSLPMLGSALRKSPSCAALSHGLEQRDSAPPTEKQFDQLFSVISRSQQGYRDLIDSFDDILIALSLEGEIRAVNRSFADLIGYSYQQIIGRPISDFLEEGSGEGPELIRRALPRFIDVTMVPASFKSASRSRTPSAITIASRMP